MRKLLAVLLVVAGCTTTPPERFYHGITEVIEVRSPKLNAVVCTDGQVTVTGFARGWWYFEASFPVEVRDVHGQPLGRGIAEAQSNWMTEEMVAFEGKINFRPPQGLTGTIVFIRDDPSGGEGRLDRPKQYEASVRFGDCKE